MSYVLTIIRTHSAGKVPITLDEFLAAATTIPGWEVDVRRRFAAMAEPEGGHLTVFWNDGEAWAANPGEAGMAALLVLAATLGARLRGENFETYRSTHETYRHPDDDDADAASAEQLQRQSPATQLQLGRLLKIAILVVLFATFLTSFLRD